MKRNSIPYKVVGGTRFFDRAENQGYDFLSLRHTDPPRMTCVSCG